MWWSMRQHQSHYGSSYINMWKLTKVGAPGASFFYEYLKRLSSLTDYWLAASVHTMRRDVGE
jgi:hypothetical protein